MTPKELSQRAVRFYHRYGEELESIRQILHIQLDKLALACTFENRLPRKAIKVVSRTKELKNFLPKLQAVAEQIDLDTAFAEPVTLNAGYNDAWFNPITAGQGFFINVFPELGQMFMAWFTYDTVRPDGSVTANFGEPAHRWATAFGPFSGNQTMASSTL